MTAPVSIMEKDGRIRRKMLEKFLKGLKGFLLFLVQLRTGSLDIGNRFPERGEIRLGIKISFDEGFYPRAISVC